MTSLVIGVAIMTALALWFDRDIFLPSNGEG